MADEYDPYEKSGGGKPGKPVVSWKKADVGDSVTGIVVPPKVDIPDRGYAWSQEWDNDARQPKVWAPRGYVNPKTGNVYKGPLLESEYLAAGFNAAEARPVVRSEVTLVTELGKFEYVSGQAKQRITEEGGSDDGIRRVILDGQSVREAHEAALAAIGADRPQPGQRWTVKLASQTPNKHGGHTNGFEVTIEAPTPETLKVVEEYVAKAKAAAATEAPGDPYAKTGAGGGQTEEPPF